MGMLPVLARRAGFQPPRIEGTDLQQVANAAITIHLGNIYGI